ncbi:probable elongation factor 1-delta isoform X4 [Ooceraea biroi]|uniref:probable elongation factor 1-delta isoform X4 n=1 Tax=Ooceraea biroi TaxID=2015173 RepID=UPI0005B9FEC8|nr:probable elongation factor 1-delta isoform X4 [Ooceraea biroi]
MANTTVVPGALAQEKIWFEKPSYDKAERKYFEKKAMDKKMGTQQSTCPILPAVGSLANEVAKARQHIKQSLQCVDDIARIANIANQDMEITSRIMNLERENQQLKNMFQEMTIRFDPWMKYMENIKKLETRLESLELRIRNVQTVPQKSEISKQNEEEEEEDDDDSEDIDLFGSDSEEEDAEVTKVREERLAAYAAKKSKKPALIAKSNIILDVKPWDDETDMKEMEKAVRKIETDGLLWGASKLVPLAFGIHKLQISCVVEDDKVSVDWLTERIQDIEDYVQSVDIAAFNKV